MHPSDALIVNALTVRFGGLVAVDEVSIVAPRGSISGLIGPNGAGKTTIFNACSGLLRPTAGRIELFGRDMTRRPAHRRAQIGLGRTFQRIELFDSLTVLANVALGREAGMAASRPWRHVISTRAERREVQHAAREALATCGIEDLGGRRPSQLSTGQRRVVELARVVAGGFPFLLLDEPSAGLDRSETAEFAAVLLALRGEGRGLLLVEHDMSLVMSVCDRISVVDFGRLVFEGAPAEVVASDVVRAAYLGNDAVEAVA